MARPEFTTRVAVRHLPEQSDREAGQYAFAYTVWTRLATPHGTMRGTFFCMTEDAQPFDAPISEFGLTLASALH